MPPSGVPEYFPRPLDEHGLPDEGNGALCLSVAFWIGVVFWGVVGFIVWWLA